ncbi:hypothetical protein PCANC_12085 [Puccinia coronata f. sp. avenae]|uniref:Uncharacterized protein n=1 Tax=Puccinia coronata f. sp. avenae TaxID=200324 RepID=A0A2N5UX42_9BASI|nr:hypothetical protein PCANC_12085 [Puccinia coronata f. sp. avenae]
MHGTRGRVPAVLTVNDLVAGCTVSLDEAPDARLGSDGPDGAEDAGEGAAVLGVLRVPRLEQDLDAVERRYQRLGQAPGGPAIPPATPGLKCLEGVEEQQSSSSSSSPRGGLVARTQRDDFPTQGAPRGRCGPSLVTGLCATVMRLQPESSQAGPDDNLAQTAWYRPSAATGLEGTT